MTEKKGKGSGKEPKKENKSPPPADKDTEDEISSTFNFPKADVPDDPDADQSPASETPSKPLTKEQIAGIVYAETARGGGGGGRAINPLTDVKVEEGKPPARAREDSKLTPRKSKPVPKQEPEPEEEDSEEEDMSDEDEREEDKGKGKGKKAPFPERQVVCVDCKNEFVSKAEPGTERCRCASRNIMSKADYEAKYMLFPSEDSSHKKLRETLARFGVSEKKQDDIIFMIRNFPKCQTDPDEMYSLLKTSQIGADAAGWTVKIFFSIPELHAPPPSFNFGAGANRQNQSGYSTSSPAPASSNPADIQRYMDERLTAQRKEFDLERKQDEEKRKHERQLDEERKKADEARAETKKVMDRLERLERGEATKQALPQGQYIIRRVPALGEGNKPMMDERGQMIYAEEHIPVEKASVGQELKDGLIDFFKESGVIKPKGSGVPDADPNIKALCDVLKTDIESRKTAATAAQTEDSKKASEKAEQEKQEMKRQIEEERKRTDAEKEKVRLAELEMKKQLDEERKRTDAEREKVHQSELERERISSEKERAIQKAEQDGRFNVIQNQLEDIKKNPPGSADARAQQMKEQRGFLESLPNIVNSTLAPFIGPLQQNQAAMNRAALVAQYKQMGYPIADIEKALSPLETSQAQKDKILADLAKKPMPEKK